MSDENNKNAVLSFLNLSDEYERRARLLPAALSILVLMPMAIAFGVPLLEWVTTLLAGVGLGAVLALGISHLASAMGNRLQRVLWPNWPHDAPTHRWLHPGDANRSKQQKEQWYAAIHRLTGLDIAATSAAGDQAEVDRVINDAVTTMRTKLWKTPQADLVRVRNVEYGYARNLTGLRLLWLAGAIASCVGSWVAYWCFTGTLLWPVVSTALVLLLPFLAFLVLPGYVRQKADYYAEGFFGALMELDQGGRGVGA